MDFSVMLLLTWFFGCSTHISLGILFCNPPKKSHIGGSGSKVLYLKSVFIVHDVLVLQVRIQHVVVKCCNCRICSHLRLAVLLCGVVESLWLR